MQADPTVYDDAELKAAQRRVPLAIVHGKNDPVVSFGMSEYAAKKFGDASWPALRLFADENAAHMFARLPVEQAVRWLEALTTDDPKRLAEFAEASEKQGRWRDRDRGPAPRVRVEGRRPRGREARGGRPADRRQGRARRRDLREADRGEQGGRVDRRVPQITATSSSFADAAKPAMEAFAKLRAKHAEPARKLMDEARALFQQGKRDEGYAKYQEIADRYYAAPQYREVEDALAARK